MKACKTGESQQFVNLTLRGKFKLTVKLVRSSFMISVCGWHLVLNLELGSESEAITAREMSHWSISHWTRLHVTLLWQLIIRSVAVCLVWTVSSVSYQRVTREFLPTRNLMGNSLTSDCSDQYPLIKGISSVTNTRPRSHGNYQRATSEFSSK